MEAKQINDYDQDSDLANVLHLPLLQKYFRLLSFTDQETIIDIGMGTGKFTSNMLLSWLPDNILELVGADICPHRVQHAKVNYSVPKVRYIELDIQSESDCNIYSEKFDHVVSFFLFHWVRDIKTSFANIFKILKPGGEFLVTFLEHGVSPSLHKLSENPRWAPYGHEDYINPLFQEKDTLPSWRNIVQAAGFEELNCFREPNRYKHKNKQACESFMKSVNPMAARISPEDVDEYYLDYLAEVKNQGFMCFETCPDSHEEIWFTQFNQITIFGKKPNIQI